MLVVTHAAPEPLRRCVESVLSARGGPRPCLKVLDNASGRATNLYLRARARAGELQAVRHARNLGKAAALNIALAEDAGAYDWTVVLDDDASVPPGWLRGLLAAAARHPQASLIGCRSVYPDGRIHSAEMFSWFDGFGHGELDLGQRSYTRWCDAVTGVCLLLRRDAAASLRFWERLGQPNEDGDLCLSARKAGLRVLYHGAVAVSHENLRRHGGRDRTNPVLMRRKWGVPSFPDSHPLDRGYAAVWNAARRKCWGEVAEECRALARIDPAPAYPLGYLGYSLAAAGIRRRAVEAFERALRAPAYKTSFTARLLACAHALEHGGRLPRLEFPA